MQQKRRYYQRLLQTVTRRTFDLVQSATPAASADCIMAAPIAKRTVNPDLARERASSSIDVDALTALLDGGAARSARRRELEAVIENDPVFSNAGNIFMVRTATRSHVFTNSIGPSSRSNMSAVMLQCRSCCVCW
jgi:Acyl-coenzyme A oxidase N-terminal